MFKLNRMSDICCDGCKFEKKQVPLPNLSTEKIFPVRLPVSALFEPECKWRLIEEFGKDSFEIQEDGEDGILLFCFDFDDREKYSGM